MSTVTNDDLSAFSRLQLIPAAYGKVSSLGLDVFSRGESFPVMLQSSSVANTSSFLAFC